MRRLSVFLLTLACAVGASAPAAAQTWGVQVGAGLGYGTIPEGSTREVKATFNGGVFAVLPISNSFSFQPELKYDHRTITVNGIPTEVDYISVPILLRNTLFGIYMVQGVSINTVARASIFDVDFKEAIASPDISPSSSAPASGSTASASKDAGRPGCVRFRRISMTPACACAR